MGISKQVIVNTQTGKLEGDFQNDIYVFKGIPYAAPLMGDLRWLPPQPVRPWSGVRSAKEFGAIAPQTEMAVGPIVFKPQRQSEDCLFLNIWTPGLDNAKRPVMVWIHGGAFTIGSGSDPMNASDILPRRGDVVLVTINYRLGMLGFLRLKETTGGKIPATGNEGLLDQVAALNWVRDNIAAFGGNPKNVTVFGESAGGMSIGCLMVMPAAKGLFQNAILESGVGSTAVPLGDAVATGENFLKMAQIRKDDVKALRAITPKQLLELETKMRTEPGGQARITVTAPVIDGETIPDVTNKMAKNGSARNIPVIIGTNVDEWKLLALMQPGSSQLSEQQMLKQLGALVEAADVKELVTAYRNARERRGESITPSEISSAIQTDRMFRIPALELVEAQRDNKQLAYGYLFTWKSPVMGGALGACHGLETGFVFGNYDDTFCGTGLDADKLAECIQDAWLAFARTGDPSCKTIGKWPVYGKDRLTMILGKDCHVEAAPYEEERRAWDNVRIKSVLV
jgi:para-nitrobenzyl esterase